VVLDGVLFPEGTCLVVNTAAANRDPNRYEDPERFDITRQGPAAMVTFGGGAHHCLCAHHARVELAEALVIMARRFAGIRPAGPASSNQPIAKGCKQLAYLAAGNGACSTGASYCAESRNGSMLPVAADAMVYPFGQPVSLLPNQ
jgi:hypothetical protein